MFNTTKQKLTILKLLDDLKQTINEENYDNFQRTISALHKELFQVETLISDETRIILNKDLYEKKNKSMINFLKNQSNIDPKIIDFLSED